MKKTIRDYLMLMYHDLEKDLSITHLDVKSYDTAYLMTLNDHELFNILKELEQNIISKSLENAGVEFP